MARKTVSVAKQLFHANRMLASNYVPQFEVTGRGAGLANDDAAKEIAARAFRAGVASMITGILHDADVYYGYGYLDCLDGRPYSEATDETRRCYFVHASLKAEYARLTEEADEREARAKAAQA